jgi:S-ribosylhomocysteine lyase LuxS involved in autoinducer biosynthesis
MKIKELKKLLNEIPVELDNNDLIDLDIRIGKPNSDEINRRCVSVLEYILGGRRLTPQQYNNVMDALKSIAE